MSATLVVWLAGEAVMAPQAAYGASCQAHFDLTLYDSGSNPGVGDIYRQADNLTTVFTGYETLEQEAQIILALVDGKTVLELTEGTQVELLLDRTPFYAEAGGQVGDSGVIEAAQGKIRVDNAIFSPWGQIIHKGVVTAGKISLNDSVRVKVDSGRRKGICRSHTSTHLLHRALRNTLGDHINQAGSLVASERLRFDFNHFSALSGEELQKVEAEVNKMVLANAPVTAVVTTLEEAKGLGATAIFTDKYEEKSVRMVSAGDYTRELCGGTHVSSTGEIGLFRIVSEEGIGSGLRRIEATVGMNSYRQSIEQQQLLGKIALALNTAEGRLEEAFTEHLNEYKLLLKTAQDLKQRLAGYEVKSLLSAVKDINGVKLLSAEVSADSFDSLRMVMDEVKSSLASIVLVLGAVSDGKVFLVSSVTHDLVKNGISANDLIKEVARQVGGGGGGKPDLAQAGGKDAAALPAALDSVENLIRKQLKSKGQV